MVFSNNLLLGAAGAGGGYTIDQSIRFDSVRNSDLTRTLSGDGNLRTGTFSFWMKRSGLGSLQEIFTTYSIRSSFFFNSNDTLSMQIYNGASYTTLTTTAVFRDPSAFAHYLFRWDTTQATATDRLQFYYNDVLQTVTGAYPAQNSTTTFSDATYTHVISGDGPANTLYEIDGYLAEIHYVDGTALAATDFGEYNADGVWIPIEASPTYGTNGFYITGATDSDLGEDFSGNNNDFTSSGLTSADQMLDTPTDNWSTWNPTSGTSIYPATFSDGNLTAIRSGSGTNIVGSTISFPATGNWYAEFTIDATGSGSHIWQVGIIEVDDAERFDTVEPRLGNGAKGYAYTTNWSGSPVPNRQNNGSAVSYGTLGSATHVIGVHLNNGTLVFYHNNVSQGTAYSSITGEYIFAWSGQGSAKVTANFGQSGFTYTPPSSAVALSTANLPDPTIADPSAHFQPTLYSGNSSTQEVNQSGNSTFTPGWVWIKPRNGAGYSHRVFDQVRGATVLLTPDSTGAESTNIATLTSFDADGFTLGSHLSVNETGKNMVAWQWKANGAGSSNTDGSVTSTVSNNSTSNFSIVKYTGTGSGSSTVGHGLGVTPDMIIVKHLDRTQNWRVFHTKVGVGSTLFLNSTAAAAADPDRITAVSSTTFTAAANMNESADYIAYCFAEIPGYSSIGSYTGNGSATDGPFVYTGFKPAFVMFKVSTNAPTGWAIIDNKRSNPFNPTDGLLQPDQSNAEGTTDKWDILSNGFKVRTTWPAVNGNGYTVTYMAFAETPFKTATAR